MSYNELEFLVKKETMKPIAAIVQEPELKTKVMGLQNQLNMRFLKNSSNINQEISGFIRKMITYMNEIYEISIYKLSSTSTVSLVNDEWYSIKSIYNLFKKKENMKLSDFVYYMFILYKKGFVDRTMYSDGYLNGNKYNIERLAKGCPGEIYFNYTEGYYAYLILNDIKSVAVQITSKGNIFISQQINDSLEQLEKRIYKQNDEIGENFEKHQKMIDSFNANIITIISIMIAAISLIVANIQIIPKYITNNVENNFFIIMLINLSLIFSIITIYWLYGNIIDKSTNKITRMIKLVAFLIVIVSLFAISKVGLAIFLIIVALLLYFFQNGIRSMLNNIVEYIKIKIES